MAQLTETLLREQKQTSLVLPGEDLFWAEAEDEPDRAPSGGIVERNGNDVWTGLEPERTVDASIRELDASSVEQPDVDHHATHCAPPHCACLWPAVQALTTRSLPWKDDPIRQQCSLLAQENAQNMATQRPVKASILQYTQQACARQAYHYCA